MLVCGSASGQLLEWHLAGVDHDEPVEPWIWRMMFLVVSTGDGS